MGETLEYSDLAALYSFVCLMVKGDVRKDAANFHAWASLLACNNPNGKCRLIAIGTVARRLFSCAMRKMALPGTHNYFTLYQIANSVPACIEVSIHAFRESIAQHG